MPKLTLGITGVPEILGRDYRIEERYWGPLIKNVLFKVIRTQPRSQESSPTDGGRVREDRGNQFDLPLNVFRILLVA